jgi:OOP family OmpA-OmpF porin
VLHFKLHYIVYPYFKTYHSSKHLNMSFNLVDAAKGLFTNELVGKASSYLGESENAVSKAIAGIIPTILGAVTDKATSSTAGATSVTQLAKEADDSGFLGNLGSFVSNDGAGLLNRGSGLLNGLFGESKSNLLSTLISQFSGIKNSSSNSLLSLAAPAILGMLGRHVKSNGLDAGGLASLLSSQKSSIMNAVPSGLNLGSLFSSWGGHSSVPKDISHAPTHHPTPSKHEDDGEGGGGTNLIWPLLFLALLGAGAWYFFKDGCRSNHSTTEVRTDTTGHDNNTTVDTHTTSTTTIGSLDSTTGDFIYNMGENVTLNLPNNGGSLTVGKNSTEYKLVQFLNDGQAMLDTVKGNWFEFTNVRFKSGGADITDESLTQLKNLVSIAKSYPNAKFKIGGYTDNSGSAELNKTLSQKRADAVAAKLKELGITAAGITGAEGYGQEWPIASNDTPEGRAQNRRVAVNVKAK